MSKSKQLGILAIIAIIVLSNVATYKVDQHFDYVRALERTVVELGGELNDLEEENLGLKVTSDQPSK